MCKDKDDNYANLLRNIDPTKFANAVQASVDGGTKIFDESSLEEVTYPLTVITRMFMFKNNITKEKLNAKFNEMALNTAMGGSQASSGKNNLRKQIAGKVSWDTLEKLITICGYRLVDMSVTLADDAAGEVSTIKLSDRGKYIKNRFTVKPADKINFD